MNGHLIFTRELRFVGIWLAVSKTYLKCLSPGFISLHIHHCLSIRASFQRSGSKNRLDDYSMTVRRLIRRMHSARILISRLVSVVIMTITPWSPMKKGSNGVHALWSVTEPNHQIGGKKRNSDQPVGEQNNKE